MKRVFLIVLDSLGIGEMPDAAAFGDVGTNTLKRISASSKFSIPNLQKLGLGKIDGVDYLGQLRSQTAAVARVAELGCGKDTTAGHWELAGLVSERPMPTYPDGFPGEIIEEFEKRIGRGTLCNKPYSGTAVIAKYGEEHVKTGKPIVYTSADSVFQIAAHEDIIPLETLYEYCRIAREILVGEHAVGRVIARPFVGSEGNYKRTENRHDFSLTPPKKTAMDLIGEAGLDVISVGKISDIFAARGITESHPTHSNAEGVETALKIMRRDFTGLCFINLVDFDMLYGHRQDVDGYAHALSEFDEALPSLLEALRDDDMLIITADHGCDPGDDSTDHTREYIPLLVYGRGVRPENLGTLRGFTSVGRLVADCLGCNFTDAPSEKIYDKIFGEKYE